MPDDFGDVTAKAIYRLRDSIDRRRKLSTVYTADVLALLAAHDLLKDRERRVRVALSRRHSSHPKMSDSDLSLLTKTIHGLQDNIECALRILTETGANEGGQDAE